MDDSDEIILGTAGSRYCKVSLRALRRATDGWLRQCFRSSLFVLARRNGRVPLPDERGDPYIDLALI